MEDREKSIVVTNNSVSQALFFKKISDSLAGSKIYNTVTQHSPIDEIRKMAEEVRGKGVKFFVSVGGGSVIDSVKVLRSLVDMQISQIAIPTTLSAAEFSHIAGYTENGEKKGIRDKKLAPKYVILDPEVTLETPTDLWRSTGIRAIDHAVESTLGDRVLDIRVQMARMASPHASPCRKSSDIIRPIHQKGWPNWRHCSRGKMTVPGPCRSCQAG